MTIVLLPQKASQEFAREGGWSPRESQMYLNRKQKNVGQFPNGRGRGEEGGGESAVLKQKLSSNLKYPTSNPANTIYCLIL